MRHLLLAAYALVCLACLIWPVYPLIGTYTEPLVLGLPPAFAWVAGWALSTFIALFVYHRKEQRDQTGGDGRERQPEDRERHDSGQSSANEAA